jgi:acetyltransferase-like isoleucine patch superfamily enzyme
LKKSVYKLVPILKFIRRKIFRSLQVPRILFYKLVSNVAVAGKPILRQPLQAVGRGIIEFHGEVNIGIFPSPYFFSSYAYLEARNPTARISIGNGTWINNGFSAVAEHTFIRIGERVLIGTNVEIIDSDFHGIMLVDRGFSKQEWALPVIVQDDVFLGSNVRICKGVTIGAGSIIANGSIVVKDVPSGVIAAGNPAVVIRRINSDD